MRFVFYALCFIFIASCGGKKITTYSNLANSTGYLCGAIDYKTNKVNFVWAKEKNSAIAYAIARCKKHSHNAPNCAFYSCVNNSSSVEVSKVLWYTCYVDSKKSNLVWSANSHDRLEAITLAYNRCVNVSVGKPSCSLSYCMVW